jgi:hypothetical protein
MPNRDENPASGALLAGLAATGVILTFVSILSELGSK